MHAHASVYPATILSSPTTLSWRDSSLRATEPHPTFNQVLATSHFAAVSCCTTTRVSSCAIVTLFTKSSDSFSSKAENGFKKCVMLPLACLTSQLLTSRRKLSPTVSIDVHVRVQSRCAIVFIQMSNFSAENAEIDRRFESESVCPHFWRHQCGVRARILLLRRRSCEHECDVRSDLLSRRPGYLLLWWRCAQTMRSYC